MPPKITAKGAPRTPPNKRPPPQKRPPPNRSVQGGGVGASLLGAGVQLGTASIAAKALNDTLGQLTENPMLLAAVAGVALVFLMR